MSWESIRPYNPDADLPLDGQRSMRLDKVLAVLNDIMNQKAGAGTLPGTTNLASGKTSAGHVRLSWEAPTTRLRLIHLQSFLVELDEGQYWFHVDYTMKDVHVTLVVL